MTQELRNLRDSLKSLIENNQEAIEASYTGNGLFDALSEVEHYLDKAIREEEADERYARSKEGIAASRGDDLHSMRGLQS